MWSKITQKTKIKEYDGLNFVNISKWAKEKSSITETFRNFAPKENENSSMNRNFKEKWKLKKKFSGSITETFRKFSPKRNEN
jgi:hypothetical protein